MRETNVRGGGTEETEKTQKLHIVHGEEKKHLEERIGSRQREEEWGMPATPESQGDSISWQGEEDGARDD